MAEDGDRPAKAYRAHGTHGRVRLRLERPVPRAVLESMTNALASCQGVTRVRARPNTGSVIVEGAGSADEIMAAIEASDAVALVAAPTRPPVGQVAQMGLLKLDSGIKDRTGGRLDFHAALGVLLTAGAAVQLYRGQLAGPAATLLMGALAMFEARK